MEKRSVIVVIVSLLLLSGLAVWQIENLGKSQRLKSELEEGQMQSLLLASAIELRKLADQDGSYRTDLKKKMRATEEIIERNFEQFERSIQWGYFNGERQPDSLLNKAPVGPSLRETQIRVCTSCLIMISIGSKDEYLPEEEDKGYVLDQTPAQMREISGLDLASLAYLHLYSPRESRPWASYLFPVSFIVGIAAMIIWLLSLNGRQRKLIHQKNEFVSHLSHQFQTPLSSIKLGANLLSKGEGEPQELVRIIRQESNRLENHIKTVLHWVKSDASRLEIKLSSVSITELLEDSIKQMNPIFLSNGAAVRFLPPQEELYIQADREHLQLMLFNLWDNAIKHNEQEVTLTISCSIEANQVSLITVDNGRGMDKNEDGGSYKGLGLRYVKTIMDMHGGSLKLSEAIDGGLIVALIFSSNA